MSHLNKLRKEIKMNGYREARCPQGHQFRWLTGTPFVCPICKHTMYPGTTGPLTPREHEVMALVGEGLTNKKIAEELVIEECTVENHMHKILRKLNLSTRTKVARYAWEHGLVRDTVGKSLSEEHVVTSQIEGNLHDSRNSSS